ncbi:unnamed protein product [Ceutorhynchus assimilis]|uniref:Rho guanine nucleotide exchange factor 11 n=1 Tax=Ceutorhynchus assimilis TaxID=467358 RepID=A0A9N9MIV6_9CUCU|nr:unnamed protein product [Ceutorhynchus assimilis]
MWSKQADNVRTPKPNNMTTFRNKITNRKSKNNADNNNPTDTASLTDNKLETDKKKQQQQQQTKSSNPKTGRNRTRKQNKKEAAAKEKNEKNLVASQDKVTIIEKETNNDECDGVVLRNSSLSRTNSTSVKRYSDSFVLENQLTNQETEEKQKVTNPTPLTRALSGFFVIDSSKRHNRRFSDLFRPVSSKFSGSTESLQIPIKLEKNVPEKVVKQDTKNESKANKKAESAAKKNAQTFAKPSTTESNSYLKRVKSKIYKSKSDDTSKIEVDSKYKKLKPKKSLDLNGRIPEEDVVSPTSGGIQKSLGHFHFGRLTRQTTNLERISRPFGSQKSVETSQTDGLERPILAKSKSSSAINLSLLRTRRAKLLEQSAPLCKDEFDFIAFGDVKSAGSSTSLHRFPSWLHLNKGEAKVSQPVSRTGSDRRPDAVREEGARPVEDSNFQQQGDGASDHHTETSSEKKDTNMPQESSSNLHLSGAKRRTGGHINRSESVKEQSEKSRKQQRRNISDPSHAHNTSSYDVDERQDASTKNTESGSSSNSSISVVNGRLSESPSNSMDVHQATVRTQSDSDSDMDNETDPLNWRDLVTEEELKKLNPNEKKRQEVINELFLTEASHMRMLKVLYKLFYKSIHSSQLLKPDELNLIFPNIKELLDIHTEINKEMRRIRKEDPLVRQIGDMLVNTFTGTQGEQLQKASAAFCERQQLALEFIKRRRERDNKFDALLSECEKKRQCKRLQLQGIVPYEMQRLTRYPLLLERLIKSVEAAEKTCSEYQDELVKLRLAHQSSKDILRFVNEATKVAHNKHRLEEIQRHLDVSNFRNNDHPIVYDFKNIDLTRYKLILEGSLQLRRPNKAPVQVHVLLMEEMVVILQKENEKFLLKFFQSGAPTQMAPLSPIIKMSTLLVRENAVCKNALFLVNTSTTSSQMYDLHAEDEPKREIWLKQFSDAADAYNRREGKPIRSGPILTQPLEPVSDSDSDSIRGPEPELVVPPEVKEDPQSENEEVPATVEAEPSVDEAKDSQREEPESGAPESSNGGGGDLQQVTEMKVSAEEWPLIQPSQVCVEVPPVHTAESMLTPLEQIRRKDALVKQALAEKEDLVADMLAIPREHFEHIADMTTTNNLGGHTSDITDRLLASVFQVDILQKAVNEALNITESEVMAARGGKSPVCTGQEVTETRSVIPSVPAGLVGDIAASLSLQLTTLLSEFKQVEDERDRLRKELHKVREQLHVEHKLHSPVPFEDPDPAVTSDESNQEIFCESISEEPN